MAATGIQEHNEGTRKQRILDRAAWARKMMLRGSDEDLTRDLPGRRAPEDPEAPGYMRKMGSPPGITHNPYARDVQERRSLVDMDGNHSPTAIDRLRRDQVRKQQLIAYSAKLPDRLSSIDFQQQW